MNRDLAIGLFIGFIAGNMFGYWCGRYEASEGFYKSCQGGKVMMGTVDNPLEVVGCAELARRIR